MRAVRSRLPPGANGTIRVIGLFGKSSPAAPTPLAENVRHNALSTPSASLPLRTAHRSNAQLKELIWQVTTFISVLLSAAADARPPFDRFHRLEHPRQWELKIQQTHGVPSED